MRSSILLVVAVAFMAVGNIIAAPNTRSTFELVARTTDDLNNICSAYDGFTPKFDALKDYVQSPECTQPEAFNRFQTVAISLQLIVETYSSCPSCNAVGTTDPTAVHFRQSFVAIFLQFQLLIEVISQKWTEYKQIFEPCIEQFDGIFQALVKFCASLKIDVKALLLGANVNLDLFAALNINISALLDVKIGLGLGLGIGL